MKSIYLIMGGGIFLLIIAGYFAVGAITNTKTVNVWPGTDIPCRLENEQHFARQIQIALSIRENGMPISIPRDVGVSGTCISELHTGEGDGMLYIESTSVARTYTLSDFFSVWGEPIEQNGSLPKAIVNGVPVSSPQSIILTDNQTILLMYGEGSEEEKDNTISDPTFDGEEKIIVPSSVDISPSELQLE